MKTHADPCLKGCPAATNIPGYMAKIREGDWDAAAQTGLSTGHPVRVIGNKLAREFTKLERQGASPEELDRLGAGKLKSAALDGDIQCGSVMAGQIAGIIHCIKPADEIMQEIMDEVPGVINGIRDLSKKGGHLKEMVHSKKFGAKH